MVQVWLILTLILAFASILLLAAGGIGAAAYLKEWAVGGTSNNLLTAWWHASQTFGTAGGLGVISGFLGFLSYQRYKKLLKSK